MEITAPIIQVPEIVVLPTEEAVGQQQLDLVIQVIAVQELQVLMVEW